MPTPSAFDFDLDNLTGLPQRRAAGRAGVNDVA